ncbi:mannitol operon transcriptional antiterminator [Clostridium saccharoperbutylacetonicum]|uniref:Transcriptional regulator MtlR n=1 Tax=Clostridium saccharoperbutylacetonicum N1-4(HMT) TaxID=931276 RepID=M1MME2_9CLOT|nr:BglG family transcription antiterminator [Clostridium saccharoperbutylacetonicum]AGF55916.1 transcriptional regulator MtlR [Clostridium saccharoperbutylacetonicum N1-4(HMT)]NRT63345.1 mannitol operon transcriptional antiterminator [Clostridium saccharoperbutylacetonicum]NSB26707.1 mannitol operon transcriptional antiterminator [Clostridium saccharoperbutylacetonicum]NSB46058.1 mannitol operon transcriptional antiterminator [Clostridium saccharoperbutylacetonicum]
MNSLTPRQQFILNTVLNEETFNIKRLHKDLDISERTILREISSINKRLKKNSVTIFNDENMNLSISGKKENIEDIKKSLEIVPIPWLFSKEQRQVVIICELLVSKEPLKASYFSHKFNVVMGSISLDIDSIEERLISKNLCIIRKRSYGISIQGSEWNKRNALVELIFEFKPFEDLLAFLYDEKVDPIIKNFFNIIFGSEDIKLIKDILKDNDLGYLKGNDVKYFSLFIQLLLSIKKTKNGENIYLPNHIKENILSLEEYKKIQYLGELLQEKNIHITEDELVYLCLYLSDYKYYISNEQFVESDINYENIAKEVTEEVSKKIHVNIAEDGQLIKDLAQHFRQTFYMLNLGLKVINPLINEIKEHYTNLYSVIKNTCRLIFSRYNLKIPPEEAGYITMHIAVAIQKQQAMLGNIKVLVICPSGIGSSRILCNKIKELFSEIGIIDVVSLHDINNTIDKNNYDLILSTVPVNLKMKDNLIVISHFMTETDIDKIGNFISNFKVNNREELELFAEAEDDGVTSNEYELANTMVKNFQLKKSNSESFVDLINFIVEDIHEINIGKDKEIIRKLIFKREEKGNVVIPETSVALIHTRSDEIVRPFVGVYRINNPLSMKSVGFSEEKVDTFIVMFARNDESNYILKILGKISASLIEKKEFVKVLKSGNAIEIRDYLINIINNEEED